MGSLEAEVLAHAQKLSALQAELEAAKNEISVLQNSRGERHRTMSVWNFDIAAWFCVGLTDRGFRAADHQRAERKRRIQVMEMRCYRKILCISYKDHVTNRKSMPRSSRQSDHTKTS